MRRFFLTFLFVAAACVPRTVPGQTLNIPGKPGKEFLKAQSLERQGKLDEAKALYRRIYEAEGADNAFWKLIRLCEMTGDFEEMERLALDKLRKSPGDFTVKRYLARAYYGRGEEKKGRRVLMDIVNGHWGDMGRVFTAASEFTRQNDLDRALAVYGKARNKLKRPELFAGQMARIYGARMEYCKAIEEQLKLLEGSKAAFAAVEDLIRKALEAGYEPKEVEKPLVSHLGAHPRSIKAARLLSNFKYRTGDYEGAYEALIPTAAATNNPKEVRDLAERYRADGLDELAVRVYEDYYRFFKKDAKRAHALLEAASIRISSNDIEGGLEDLRRVAEDYAGTEEGDSARLRILRFSPEIGGCEERLEKLSGFASSTKYRAVAREAHMMRGRICLRNGRLEEAASAFREARLKSRSKEEKYETAVSLALLGFFAGDYESMAREIETCVRTGPAESETNDLLALKVLGMRCSGEVDRKALKEYAGGMYALYRGDVEEAVERFSRAAADTSAVPAPYAAVEMARVFLGRGEGENGVKWYLSAADAFRDETERVGALAAAADILSLEEGGRERAVSLYREALTRYPGNLHESEIRRKLKALVER